MSSSSCEGRGADSDGANFVTCAGSAYQSLHYHQTQASTTHPKSLWAVPRDYECHTFCLAELNHWVDEKGYYWSIRDGGQKVLGTRKERLGFFWRKSGVTAPWHGYPVGYKSGLRQKHEIPDELVESWYKAEIISATVRKRILDRRI